MQSFAKSSGMYFIGAGILTAALTLASSDAAAQPARPDAIEAAADRQQQARLADADTLLALTAEGAVLYSQDKIKRNGYQYCSQAVSLANAGEFRQSVRAASKALYLADATNDPELRASANRDLAIVYNYAGQPGKAIEFAREALRYEGRDARLIVGPANKVIGDVQARRGDYEGAIAAYEAALAGSSERYAPVVQASLASALIEAGGAANLARAEQLLGALKTPADAASAVQLERTRARLLLARNQLPEARAAYLQVANRTAGIDGAYNRLWGWDGVARADLARGDKRAAAEAITQALASVDEVRARFHSEEFKMGLFSNLQDVFDRGVSLRAELGDMEQAFALSEKSRSRALLDSVRGRATIADDSNNIDIGAAAVDLPTLQRALNADERLVQFHALPDRLIAWVVGRDAITSKTIEIKRDELGELVDTFRTSIVRGQRTAIGNADKRTVIGNADKLGAALAAPLGLADGLRLIIVPHGPLHYLPFQALRVNGRYLIETHPIAISPSASIAAQLVRRFAHVPAALTAFGDPRIADKYDLPGAQAEVKAIAKNFPRSQLFMGAEATKTQFRQIAAQSPILHVAAHAQADDVDPLYSRILLANEDGKQSFLEAHEIMDLPLRGTSLITLSACESALGRVAGGDEVLGFPRSFLSAGVSALIASLWPVSDDATERLMSTLYRELAQSRDVQRAMQAGQLAVLRDPKTSHPFFWAPFNLIGDWRLTVQ
jgi:CHAT domain-containing protein